MTQTVESAASLRPVSSEQDVWTIQKILMWSTDFLKDRNITDTPRLEAEILLSNALGLKRIQLYTLFDKPVSAVEREPFKAALKRRIAGEPVAYITGERDFMSMTFKVSPDVLIPRPDTEILVEAAMDKLKPRQTEELRILDIGTGSGCIAISMAKKFPVATVTAWDISEQALTMARENASRLDASNVMFSRKDALAVDSWADASFDVILANPPYIARAEESSLAVSVKEHEPQLALFAENEGLAFYQMFAEHAKAALKPGGFIAVEIGYQQAEAVSAAFAAHGWKSIVVRKDYGKNDRVIIAEL